MAQGEESVQAIQDAAAEEDQHSGPQSRQGGGPGGHSESRGVFIPIGVQCSLGGLLRGAQHVMDC